MYYSSIGILAVLILFIVNQDILRLRVSFEKPAWKMYRRFLFTVLVYYTTDILWGIFEGRKWAVLLFADTTVYFIAMAAGVLYWTWFTVAYMEEKNPFEKFIRLAGNILAALITICAIVNIFRPVLFTVSADCIYEARPFRYVLLAAQILLLILISAYAFSRMLRQNAATGIRQRYLILAAFGLIMAVFLTFQLWYPYLPLYSIGYMMATSMLHSFVVNDEKEDYRRGIEEAEKVTELKNTITSLLNNMPALAFTKDAQTGVYLACNQAFAEYAHKETPEGVAGLTDAEIFDAGTAAHFVEDDRMALSISKPYIFFEDVPDAAGNRRQFQTTKIKYTDSSGRLCVLGMCQDVTDMVRIQHENAMTKEAYESAVSSGLMYTHIAQTLARDYTDMYYVNADTEEFIRYRRDEQGRALSEIQRGWHFFSDCITEMSSHVYADDREAFRQALKRKTLMKSLTLKDTFIMTYRQISENGPIYVSMKVSLMADDEQFIIVGITNVDAEMRDAMAKSEVLAEALASAEEANKARTSFFSGMSREIRAPVNTIIGLDTQALEGNNLDASTREYLEKIGVNARHLLSLINDIPNMNRIEPAYTAHQDGRTIFSEKKRANLTGRRILLAEDLVSNAEIMTDILEMENIRTDHVANGRIAVEMFGNSEPGTYAAILMDVRMPEMDGLEAAAAIRAMEREDAKSIPIIALTANAFDEDVQRSLQAGMNAHLSKPIEADYLIRLLGELIYKAEEAAEQ